MEGEKGCEGWRLGLIGATETSHGKSRGNREGRHGLSSSPALQLEEEDSIADRWGPAVSDTATGSDCQRQRKGKGGACAFLGRAWAGARGKRGDTPLGQRLEFFFLFVFLFQSFSKRDFKSFLEIEQNVHTV